MGYFRFVRRQVPIVHATETVMNMMKEGSVKKGLKKTYRQDIKDNPLTNHIYKEGKYDGKIEGYVEAADEYEKKLIAQAEEFLAQKEIAKNRFDAYKALLDEYEEAISELEEKVERTEAENELLRELLLSERKLRKLKVS